MPSSEPAKPPVGIVFDTDLGKRIDAVLALALLHGFDGKNEARIAAVSISNPDLRAAEFCDVISRFYAGASSGPFAAFIIRGLPIGLAEGKGSADTPMLTVPLSKRGADGKP